MVNKWRKRLKNSVMLSIPVFIVVLLYSHLTAFTIEIRGGLFGLYLVVLAVGIIFYTLYDITFNRNKPEDEEPDEEDEDPADYTKI
jgi:hypothetical protein